MFIYNTLESTGIDIIHKTFLEAFSDYQVKIDLPLWKFQQMLERRGYVPQISVGAFENNALVGVILNGLRGWNGKLTAYDTGTGVLGTYRKKGITSHMFSNVTALCREMKVEQYLLEVIQANTPAVQLYKKQSFGISRSFECFHLDKNEFIPSEAYNVKHMDVIDSDSWKELSGFWDFQPSWQNSIDSINAVPNAFVYSIVRFDDIIAGYGVIDTKTGDIPQLAVHKNFRGRGIAKSIVSDLVKNTESTDINLINVDVSSKSMKDFLIKFGFECSVNQYEMILEL